jgi:hypothetical protein
MSRGRKAPPRKILEAHYTTWKGAAVRHLRGRPDIDATTIAERIWMQFYVRRFNPKEAADWAEMVFRSTRQLSRPLPKKKV